MINNGIINRFAYVLVGFLLGAVMCGAVIAAATEITATPTNDKVYVDGNEIKAEVYKIGGSNYFKLRDLAAAVNFSVVYDGKQQRVIIKPSEPYNPDEQYTTPTQTLPYILLNDDGAPTNAFKDTAYMGMKENGNDGSISVKVDDTSKAAKVGNASMKFSYTSTKDGPHWAGVALLWKNQDWKGRGPDLKGHAKLTFWVSGSGGTVKFFIEGDGYDQTSTVVTIKEEWQKITLEKGNWEYVNIPFGWACNERDTDVKGGTITFWVDGLQFE